MPHGYAPNSSAYSFGQFCIGSRYDPPSLAKISVSKYDLTELERPSIQHRKMRLKIMLWEALKPLFIVH